MKEKGVTKIALILLVLVCVFAIVACSDNVNTDGDVCKHIYTEKADATYLKSAATCTEKAVYYKSCSLCGALALLYAHTNFIFFDKFLIRKTRIFYIYFHSFCFVITNIFTVF